MHSSIYNHIKGDNLIKANWPEKCFYKQMMWNSLILLHLSVPDYTEEHISMRMGWGGGMKGGGRMQEGGRERGREREGEGGREGGREREGEGGREREEGREGGRGREREEGREGGREREGGRG